MKYVNMSILALKKLTIFDYNVQMMMMVVFIMEKHRVTLQRTCWKRKHYGGFLECAFFGILFGS